MGVFEDIHLEWRGEEFVIKSDRVMGAIARIEDVVTLKELYQMTNERGTLKLGTIASAYASVLRYAGAKVKDEDVYQGMFNKGEQQQAIVGAINGLLSMMVPPSAQQKVVAEETRKNSDGQARKVAASLSKKSTKRQSEAAE